MRRLLSALTALAACALLTSCGDAAKTRVPPVDTTSLGEALARLHERGLSAEVDSFNALPSGTGLEGAAVGDQDPEPGAVVKRGSTVRLTMGYSPIPSPAIPFNHPRTVTVPDLVGLTWPEAEKRLTGLWPQIVAIAPLPADKSDGGLDAFVITKQSLQPGRTVPYLGKPSPNGIDMKPSTIQLELGVS